LFLFTRGIRPADVVNLEEGMPFPESVKDMLAGGLGEPMGGWPKDLVRVVLGKGKKQKARAAAVNLVTVREELTTKLKHAPNDDELFSHLMYPDVFAEFSRIQREFGDVSVLPTPAFFYGLKPGEEITVDIEEGKTLFIKLINVGDPDKDGRRIISFELNGMPREATAVDKSAQVSTKARAKANASNPAEVGAPIPGMITSVGPGVGSRVKKGDKLLTLEAMKMQTTLYAPVDGVIDAVFAGVGDAVDGGDLLVKLRS
ncbi:MAG: biotin/lipoyl-containing protein, partial [Terrimicrobiaceae bacterium]